MKNLFVLLGVFGFGCNVLAFDCSQLKSQLLSEPQSVEDFQFSAESHAEPVVTSHSFSPSSFLRLGQEQSRKTVPPESCKGQNDYGEACITEEQGRQISNLVIQEFIGDFHAVGTDLALDYRWADPKENATYSAEKNQWRIVIYGGAVRAREVTYETVALIACHELGHIYGLVTKTGDPKLHGFEGEADYFAMSVCLPRILPRMKTLSQVPLPAPVLLNCRVSKKIPVPLCERGNQAAYAGSLFRARLKSVPMPSFLNPDPLRVSQSSPDMSVQCGLDTYYAASVGRPRPRCWFRE